MKGDVRIGDQKKNGNKAESRATKGRLCRLDSGLNFADLTSIQPP